MARSAQVALEFHALREMVSGYSTCAPGRRVTAALEFTQDRAALEAAFALIGEAVAWLRAGSELGFGSLADPAEWLARLESLAAVLTPVELLHAASLCDTCAWLKQNFRGEAKKYALLDARAASLGDFRATAAAIRHAVMPNGEISDEASSALKKIRQSQARTRDKIQKTLGEIMRSRAQEGGEDYITIRNDRFVIPVRAAERRQVQGVVHGASATGQTVFVEPLATLDMNNQLVQLAEDEAAEIARILRELTERLQGSLGPLRHAAATIAELDSTFARARFAREFNCVAPKFAGEELTHRHRGTEAEKNSKFHIPNSREEKDAQNLKFEISDLREDQEQSPRMILENARHPVLEANLRRQGREIVATSLALGGTETVLVISGPNTGGKTVALKTVGLAALSAQSGIPVAAERAEMPMFDRVLVDIGDEQSIAADLSTFSAHMTNLRSMLAEATPRSLVLVDEMGTGTAPEEGAALAVALLEEFRARGCLTLATTHHDRLKTYASTTAGVLNAAVEFDTLNLRPTYRLMVGVPGVSSGIDIARRLELPERVIERARAEMDPKVREAGELIAWLHRSRDELEEIKRQAAEEAAQLQAERRALQTEWAERQRKRLAELEKQFAESAKKFEQEIARLTGEIKDRELRAQMEKQGVKRGAKVARDVREETNAAVVQHLDESQKELGIASSALREEPVAPEQLVAGMKVRVRGFKQPVIIRQRDGNSAEVQAGPLRMKVKVDDIVAVVEEETGKGKMEKGKGAASSAPTRDVVVHAEASSGGAAEEINVIGKTVEEATGLVDKFLDNAALANKSRVRIIHGHGTGALRSGLAEFLSTHPLVESIHAEEQDRGGAAVTIVELGSS